MKKAFLSIILASLVLVGLTILKDGTWNFGKCSICGDHWQMKTLIEDDHGLYEYWDKAGHAFTTSTYHGW